MFEDLEVIRQRIGELRVEHRALDAAIEQMHQQSQPDELELKRLKRRKLRLKDTIVRLESALIPDLNA